MNYIIDIILFVTIFCAYFSLRSYVKKRTDKTALLTDLTDEMRGLEAEFNRIADRDISLIEEKDKDIKETLTAAEKEIARYKTIVDNLSVKYAELKSEEEKLEAIKKETAELQKAFGEQPLSQKIENLQKKGWTSVQIARKLDKPVAEIELEIAQQN
jgi:chromosome segregation ATPase